MTKDPATRGVIHWFAHNHVAANLLMGIIIFLGLASAASITQEVFPEVELDRISVVVPYPGATPEEVEEAICTRIEEKLISIDGVKSMTSRASEGSGSVVLELERDADIQEALDDVKSEVDRISTFPDEAEEPVVTEMTNRREVIQLVVYGDTDENTLKVLAERARNDLTETAAISQANLSGVRDYEIAVEVSEESLRRYNLTFDQVVAAIRASSLDLPGGSIKSAEAGEVLVRTLSKRYTGEEFARATVLTRPDGVRVTLGEIARVNDGFDEDAPMVTRYDGQPAALVQIYRVGEQDAITVADTVKAYVAQHQSELPTGVKMGVWRDRTDILKARRDLLVRNGIMGFILVFLSLLLFLDLKVSFWVALGIPVAFLGAFIAMPQFDVSINMISLFAFIVVLGIVVDDAIVVAENIYSHWERGKSAIQASVDGAREMVVPVTFAVLTSVAAFAPLLQVEGTMGKFMWVIPVVVIAVLMTSLVESLLVLPAHLSLRKGRHHSANGEERIWFLERLRRKFGDMLQWVIRKPYKRSLDVAVRWRYLTLAGFVGIMIFSAGWVASGKIKFNFFPKVESDSVRATLTMPQGTSLKQTMAMTGQLERAAHQLQEELRAESADGRSALEHVFTLIGGQTGGSGPVSSASTATHLADVRLQLTPSEAREITSVEVESRWRELVGPMPGVESLTFRSNLFGGGDPIDIQLRGDDFGQLTAAAERLKAKLAEYDGVQDIEDSFREGKLELKLGLKPAARTLGITEASLARQVRQGYYGEEALRIQRGRDDVKVIVRYPAEERTSLGDVERSRIRTPSGAEVPFALVANAELGRGFSSINRQERKRVVHVTADVDEKAGNASEILADIQAGYLQQLVADYPGMSYGFEGRERDRQDSVDSLKSGFIVALFVIYALLAIPFRAYLQPLLVMTAIPFGIVGAIWGHVLLGLPLTILSLFGIVALSGVVVNDSLIMIDYINRAREGGMPLHQAVLESGQKRFRPILLTTMTTFLGLAPLLFEKSVQARFLIPMGVSLAFGIVAATAITLVLIPSLYTVLEDIMRIFGIESDRWRKSAEAEEDGGVSDAGALPEDGVREGA